jgi:hypothetical protein
MASPDVHDGTNALVHIFVAVSQNAAKRADWSGLDGLTAEVPNAGPDGNNSACGQNYQQECGLYLKGLKAPQTPQPILRRQKQNGPRNPPHDPLKKDEASRAPK